MDDKIVDFKKLESLSKDEFIKSLRETARELCHLALGKVLNSYDDYIFHTFNGAIYAFYQMDLISKDQMAHIFSIVATERPDISEMIEKLYQRDFPKKEELLN